MTVWAAAVAQSPRAAKAVEKKGFTDWMTGLRLNGRFSLRQMSCRLEKTGLHRSAPVIDESSEPFHRSSNNQMNDRARPGGTGELLIRPQPNPAQWALRAKLFWRRSWVGDDFYPVDLRIFNVGGERDVEPVTGDFHIDALDLGALRTTGLR